MNRGLRKARFGPAQQRDRRWLDRSPLKDPFREAGRELPPVQPSFYGERKRRTGRHREIVVEDPFFLRSSTVVASSETASVDVVRLLVRTPCRST